MSKQQVPSVSLTIWLLKENMTDIALILPRLNELRRIPVHSGGNTIGDLYTKQIPSHPPTWIDFFEERDTLQLSTSTASGVLLVPRDGRYVAVTFGHGHALINPDVREERFGLIVTLNSVDSETLRSIDIKSFDTIGTNARVQATRRGNMREFGVNVDEDLLRGVTGTPADPTLGTIMCGADALKIRAKVGIAGLPALLDRYFNKFLDTSYRNTYDWIDHVAEVSNKSLISELDQLTLDRIQAPPFEKLWLAVPEPIDWLKVDGFSYSENVKEELLHDIHMNTFREHVAPRRLSIDLLKRSHVFAFVADNRIEHRWQTYKCLYCEQEHNGRTYLLTNGKWYRIEPEFVKQVDHRVARLAKVTVALPPYEKDAEPNYNLEVPKFDPSIVHLDRKLTRHGGGHSKIEFCDLFTKKRQMIHVKRYGGSSVLSHLFLQGANAANLWLTDAEFRGKVNNLLPSSHKVADPGVRPDPTDYEVVFAIMSMSAQPIDRALPFFSRLSLRNVARQLEGYGYNVSLLKIPKAA